MSRPKKSYMNWTKWTVIALIVVLAAFLRFHDLQKVFVFTVDEEYHVALADNLIKHFHPKLIGVSISVGFYLGPLWTYLTALLLFISHSLYVLADFAAFIGVLTAFMVFITGNELFGFQVGAIASLLYACLPLIVFYDQKYWNDTPIPLLTTTMVWAIYKAQKNARWWLLFACCLGLLFHTHLSPILVGGMGFVIFISRLRYISAKIILASCLVFFLLISPLIAFDLTHHFQNITAPFHMNKSLEAGITFNPLNHLEILFRVYPIY